jgi:hypothetical protein
MQPRAKPHLLQIISLIVLVALVGSCGFLAKTIHDDKWEMLYEARREFARMPDVQVISEQYDEDTLSLDDLTILLDVKDKGKLEVLINYPGGFDEEQQFWVTRVGECETSIELRERIRYAIDHYEQLSHRACPASRVWFWVNRELRLS